MKSMASEEKSCEKSEAARSDDRRRLAAVSAMAGIGFDREVVKGVLHRLLQVYENEWSHIEAEGYTTLLNALLDLGSNDRTAEPNATTADDRKLQRSESSRSKKAMDTSVQQAADAKSTGRASVSAAGVPPDEDDEDVVHHRTPHRKRQLEDTTDSSKIRKARADTKGKAVVANGTDAGQAVVANRTAEQRNAGERRTSIAQAMSKASHRHDPKDISRGAESVCIPYVNSYNDEKIPSDFNYIGQSIPYDKAVLRINLASIGDTDCCKKCYGDCLKRAYPCACTSETDGVFYYEEGLLRASFLQQALQESSGKSGRTYTCEGPCYSATKVSSECRGHTLRRFIKECWTKCSCHYKNCGNRIVQQGVRYKLEVFHTGEKGWGVRCADDLPAGAYVCEYIGEILTNSELDDRNKTRYAGGRHTYPMNLDADVCSERIFDDDTLLCLDATFYGNVSRFINHRCEDANMIDVPVQIETVDRHYYHVAFFTTRPVKAREELTWDYKIQFDEDHPVEAFKCVCGSAHCRQPKAKRKHR